MIPRKFKIANRTWRVQFKRMPYKHGETRYSEALIVLDTALRKQPELLRHTFMHELLHACAGTMGWKRVNHDEARIDMLASLLVQSFDTMKGRAGLVRRKKRR